MLYIQIRRTKYERYRLCFFQPNELFKLENLNKKNIEEAGTDDSVTNILNTKELWSILSPSTNLKKKEISEYAGNDKRLFMKYSLEKSKKPVFDFSNGNSF